MNQRIANWFEQGKIVEAIRGEPDYFIPDVTYRDSHDILLILSTLFEWANKNGMHEYAASCFLSVFEAYLESEELFEALDLIHAYLLVVDDVNNFLQLEMEKIEIQLRNLVNSKSKNITQDEKLRNLVIGVSKRLPNII